MPENRSWLEPTKLVRRRFAPIWNALPQLTVLATLLGWGRSTWIQQCDAHIREEQPDVATEWAYTRAQLVELLHQPRGDEHRVILADALLSAADDALWPVITEALAENPQVRLVISSVDVPRADLIGHLDYLVLTERDLAFNRAEVREYVELTTGSNHEALTIAVSDGLRGMIELISRRLRAHLDQHDRLGWGIAESSPEVHALNLIRRPAGVTLPKLSKTWQILQRVKEPRAFSAMQLHTHLGGTELADGIDLDEIFIRFRNFPFFTVENDIDTGDELLVWQHAAWQQVGAEVPEEVRREQLETGLTTIRRSGGIVAQTYYLVALERFDEANRIVTHNYQHFIAGLDAVIGDATLHANIHPALAVLQADIRIRSGLAERDLREPLDQALNALRAVTAADVESEFARTALLAHTSAFVGDRPRVLRYLEYASELSVGLRTRFGQMSTRTRSRLAEHHTLLVKVAMQVDDLARALRIAREAMRLSNPGDMGHVGRTRDVANLEDAVGMRSLAGSVSPHQDGMYGASVSVRFIEEGDDAAAIDFLQTLQALRIRTASRSAIDAHILLVRALAAPAELSVRDVLQPIERSAELWRTGVPSTHLSFAVLLAAASRNRQDEGAEIVARIAKSRDPFARLTRMLWAQWNGNFVESLGEASHAGFEGLPRFAVLQRVLVAVSQLRLEDAQGCVQELCSAWGEFEAPRLMRFALRFIPQDAFDELSGMRDDLPSGLARVLEESAGDKRNISWKTVSALSRSEIEVVRLLSHGLKNQEIAEARHVTFGTVRTQLKSIYRKLGVSDRTGALAEARAHGLISPAGGTGSEVFARKVAADK
jgi:DNA-binding CsgD family transcriptional regulator